jgi:hypothetical protein
LISLSIFNWVLVVHRGSQDVSLSRLWSQLLLSICLCLKYLAFDLNL